MPQATILQTNSRGFTIVELMIVIVVIAILAAISIVAYTNIQSRAQISRTQSELRQLGQAIQLHQADSGALPTSQQAIRQALEDNGALALGDRPTQHERFVYCYTEDGADFWIIAQYRPDAGYLHYWQASTAGMGEAPFSEQGYAYWSQNACHSVTGGRHSHSVWSNSIQ